MIIHLNEHRFNKFFLIESKNSKLAHKRTRELIAKEMEMSVDDPRVIELEQTFEKKHFGEGLNKDWFIILEPNAYMWFCGTLNNDVVQKYLQYIYRKATKFERPTEYIANVRQITSYRELKKFIDPQMAEDEAIEQEKMNNMEVNLNPNYQVLGPLSFEEANEYGNYSCPKSLICYTQSESTWLSPNYSNNNRNCCYLLLRNDWKEVEPEHDGSESNNGLPEPLNMYDGYDSYGLSMIFVWVNPRGKLHECNTRWNHSAEYAPGHGVDTAMTEVDIAHLIGAPFERVFKYDNENVKKLNERLGHIEEVLSKTDIPISMETLNSLFDGYIRNDRDTYIVSVSGLYNILDINNFTFRLDEWCNKISGTFDTSKVISVENQQGLFNYLRNDYNFLSDEWFSSLEVFCDTYGIVKQVDGSYNIITINGNKCFHEEITSIITACTGNGRAILKVNNFYYQSMLFDTAKLEVIGDRWFDGIGYVGMHEYIPVLYDSHYNFMDINGVYLFENWFDAMAKCSPAYNDGWLVGNFKGTDDYVDVYRVTPYGKVEKEDSEYATYRLNKKEYGTLR